MTFRRSIALIAAALNAASCGEGGSTQPPVATTVTVTPGSTVLTSIGATVQLTAGVLDQNGQAMGGQTITWSSDAADVATVSTGGLVTAIGNGPATVTASVGPVAGTAGITVAQALASVAKTGGDAQTDTVGQTAPTPLEVEARDAQGSPMPGVPIAFAVTQGGGSVGTMSGTTDANGRVSTQWTLGTVAGTAHAVSASATGAAVATFTATAVAGAPDTIAAVSGGGQTASQSSALPDPLVFRVFDQFGNPVEGAAVSFVVTSGGGSLEPAALVTGADGQASSVWTLGASIGPQAAEAQLAGVSGSPVMFAATASNLGITAITPDSLIEGAAATITGDGFDPTPGNNAVTLAGVAAAVTAATTNSLTITVPQGACLPARDVDVVVTVAGVSASPFSHPLRPAEYVTLAVGEQQILRDPAAFCLQFGPTVADEHYLVGVQSNGEVPSNVTATRLIAEATAPGALAVPLAPVSGRGGRFPTSPWFERVLAHRAAERGIRAFDEAFLRSAAASGTSQRTAGGIAGFVDSTVSIGDTLHTIRVQNGGASCNDRDSISVVVRARGLRSIWLEDVANPVNGYTLADYDSLSNWMDNIIFDTDTSYFGDPGDRDENARVVIVVTKEVNQLSPGLLGFVISCDFFARASGTLASNDGEFFYAKAPDPTGTFGSTYARADAFADAPFLIAHEFAHIIQFGRRIPSGGAFTSWLFEGQATYAEEVNGFAVAGRATGQDYGFAVAFNSPATTEIDWHVGAFTDLALYYGFVNATTQLATAPHECTWVGRSSEGNSGPCLGGRQIYGTPWSLFRWMGDQFGPGFPGGEQGLHKAVINNVAGGLTNLSQVVGVAADTLLAQWAAALYVDGLVGGAQQRLTFSSWDMLDVFNGLVPTARLAPTVTTFGALDLSRNVRDGSTAYFRIQGGNRPATAVRARSSTDTALGSSMRYWVVRLQ